jgi:hypothetical protein
MSIRISPQVDDDHATRRELSGWYGATTIAGGGACQRRFVEGYHRVSVKRIPHRRVSFAATFGT